MTGAEHQPVSWLGQTKVLPLAGTQLAVVLPRYCCEMFWVSQQYFSVVSISGTSMHQVCHPDVIWPFALADDRHWMRKIPKQVCFQHDEDTCACGVMIRLNPIKFESHRTAPCVTSNNGPPKPCASHRNHKTVFQLQPSRAGERQYNGYLK